MAPWAAFMIWTIGPTVQRSVLGLERFPDTYNSGYFIIKAALWVLAGLILTQAVVDAVRPRPSA